jgi:hypothetical protein
MRQVTRGTWYLFALATTIHTIQIGSDFQRLGTRVLAIILVSIVVITFVQKRLQRKAL